MDFGMTDSCRLQGHSPREILPSPPSAQVPPSLCLPSADGEERLGHIGHGAPCASPSASGPVLPREGWRGTGTIT